MALVCAFVAHHLDLGAELVDLCLDSPAPRLVAALAGRPGVRVTLCDDAYWQHEHGMARPVQVTERQRLNAGRAFRALEQDWMLFCDADEFLAPAGDFAAQLAACPAEVEFLRLPVAERVLRADQPQQGIFDGIFRRALPGQETALAEIYGPIRSMMLTAGLTGHVMGKSVLRRGGSMPPAIHVPLPGQPGPQKRREILASPPWQNWARDAVIAHFDGLTPLHYFLKLLRKRASLADAGPRAVSRHEPARRTQIASVLAQCSEAAALHDMTSLLALTAAEEAALQALGGIAPMQIAPAAACARHFPAADLSAAAFDRALRARHARLIETTGLAL